MSRIIGILFIFLCDILSVNFAVRADKWSYTDPDGPSTWAKTYPNYCNGKMQSPINIISKESIFDGFSDLVTNYRTPTDLNVVNNGHAISASVSEKLSFKGAGLPSTYLLESFHFHVGSDSSQGSEHQVDGKKFPMEMHLVHKDVSNKTAVVLSVFFKAESTDNRAFNKFTDSLQNISHPGQTTMIQSFSVKDILPADVSSFYRYTGSFTTPPCNESVEWIVFSNTVPISSSQLGKFRNVFSSVQSTKSKPLVNNYRPVQPLNKRIVRRSFDHPSFTCGLRSNLTADCRKTIDGHDVFYEVKVDPCTLPVSGTFKVSSPSIGFNVQKRFTEDIRTPIAISNLKFGTSLETHFHFEGSYASYLHITVYQFPLTQYSKKVKVIDHYFQVEGVCLRSNCSVDTWDNHWCTADIGIEKPLLIGFASALKNPCGSPSIGLEIHRSEYLKQTWVLTAKLQVNDNQKFSANLTNSIVGGHKNLRIKRAVAEASKYNTAVDLEAHVEKLEGGKTNFELYLLVKSNGGHYLIFNTQYSNPSNFCSTNKQPSGKGTKVAIAVVIVLIVLIIIGIGAYMVYRNRRAYFGHRPALVDEIEVQDAGSL